MKVLMAFVKIILKIVFFLLIIIGVISLYKTAYTMITDKDITDFFGYKIYRVTDSNLTPEVKKDDLLIVKKKDLYDIDDIIVYDYYGSLNIAKISEHLNEKYILLDNVDSIDENYNVTDKEILGSSIVKIDKFGKIYDYLISPYALIVVVIVSIVYFMVLPEKKERFDVTK